MSLPHKLIASYNSSPIPQAADPIGQTMAQLTKEAASARLCAEIVRYGLGIDFNPLSATRSAPIESLARQLAMYLCHVGFSMSLSRTALAFGRDRSTIGHACHKIEDARDFEPLDDWLGLIEPILTSLPAPQKDLLARVQKFGG